MAVLTVIHLAIGRHLVSVNQTAYRGLLRFCPECPRSVRLFD